MANIRALRAQTSSIARGAEGGFGDVRGLRDGALVMAPWTLALALEGRVFVANAGTGTSPVTFAGAYDANGPDVHLNVPAGTTILPLYIGVNFDAVGTEATMEIIGLASNTGDASATGTASSIFNMRTDAPRLSGCTFTGAVDAAGVTDPNAGNFYEFWHESRPLTDTVATSENDRIGLVFEWSTARDGLPPVIVGNGAEGSCLVVYAASNAGTGFITVVWAEIPSTTVV